MKVKEQSASDSLKATSFAPVHVSYPEVMKPAPSVPFSFHTNREMCKNISASPARSPRTPEDLFGNVYPDICQTAACVITTVAHLSILTSHGLPEAVQ